MTDSLRSPVVRIGLRSATGPRPENQDAPGARVPGGALAERKGVAIAIADGVSASEAGRIAAETCVQNFLGDYFATPESWSIQRSGAQVLNALNRWLLAQGVRFRESRRGYVTTFTAAVLKGRTLHLFHVGDARLYRLRDGAIELLTRDHRVLLDDGTPVLSRAMGLDHRLDVDYAGLEACEGDHYLLVTDGIHDVLPGKDIGALLGAHHDPSTACDALVAAARAASAIDNMTAVLMVVDRLPAASVTEHLRDFDALPLLPVLTTGLRIDGLVVERVLAESPRSQTYLVREESSGALRVLKAPSPRRDDLDQVRQEYATEQWVLRRVQHPRLPRVAEPPRQRTALYLLTDPVDGVPLARWMQQHRPAPVADALQVARQVATALRALHRRDIVHRDVRPDNVLLDANGQATLIDLGQCRVAGLGEESSGGPGVLEYAAPEHTLAPARAGERSDQFALAAMLHEMLTGKLPFDGKLAEAHQRGAFRRLDYVAASAHNPLIPAWLDAALARALAIEPARRYGDIAEFAEALARPFGQRTAAGTQRRQSLLERDPLRFWRGLAAAMTTANLLLLLLLWR